MEAAALFIIQSVGDKATPVKISRWIFRESHTVTALLGRMKKKGLIIKTEDSGRKNRWRIGLTEKGEDALHESAKRESLHVALSPIPEDELLKLESYLRKIRDQALKYSVNVPIPPFHSYQE